MVRTWREAIIAVMGALLLTAGCAATVKPEPKPIPAQAGESAQAVHPWPPMPTADEIASAIVPGQPKMPDWRVKPEALGQIAAWLQAAEAADGSTDLPPPPAHGTPLSLVLTLKDGETLTVRPAADCVTSKLADGSEMQTCTHAEDDVFLTRQGQTYRLQAPALAQWLSDDNWVRDTVR